MQFLFKAHAILKKILAMYICTQRKTCSALSSDKILHKNPTQLSANMSPLYLLGTPNHKHSVQYLLFLISVGNTGPMMSSDYNCFRMAEQQSPSALF